MKNILYFTLLLCVLSQVSWARSDSCMVAAPLSDMMDLVDECYNDTVGPLVQTLKTKIQNHELVTPGQLVDLSKALIVYKNELEATATLYDEARPRQISPAFIWDVLHYYELALTPMYVATAAMPDTVMASFDDLKQFDLILPNSIMVQVLNSQLIGRNEDSKKNLFLLNLDLFASEAQNGKARLSFTAQNRLQFYVWAMTSYPVDPGHHDKKDQSRVEDLAWLMELRFLFRENANHKQFDYEQSDLDTSSLDASIQPARFKPLVQAIREERLRLDREELFRNMIGLEPKQLEPLAKWAQKHLEAMRPKIKEALTRLLLQFNRFPTLTKFSNLQPNEQSAALDPKLDAFYELENQISVEDKSARDYMKDLTRYVVLDCPIFLLDASDDTIRQALTAELEVIAGTIMPAAFAAMSPFNPDCKEPDEENPTKNEEYIKKNCATEQEQKVLTNEVSRLTREFVHSIFKKKIPEFEEVLANFQKDRNNFAVGIAAKRFELAKEMIKKVKKWNLLNKLLRQTDVDKNVIKETWYVPLLQKDENGDPLDEISPEAVLSSGIDMGVTLPDWLNSALFEKLKDLEGIDQRMKQIPKDAQAVRNGVDLLKVIKDQKQTLQDLTDLHDSIILAPRNIITILDGNDGQHGLSSVITDRGALSYIQSIDQAQLNDKPYQWSSLEVRLEKIYNVINKDKQALENDNVETKVDAAILQAATQVIEGFSALEILATEHLRSGSLEGMVRRAFLQYVNVPTGLSETGDEGIKAFWAQRINNANLMQDDRSHVLDELRAQVHEGELALDNSPFLRLLSEVFTPLSERREHLLGRLSSAKLVHEYLTQRQSTATQENPILFIPVELPSYIKTEDVGDEIRPLCLFKMCMPAKKIRLIDMITALLGENAVDQAAVDMGIANGASPIVEQVLEDISNIDPKKDPGFLNNVLPHTADTVQTIVLGAYTALTTNDIHKNIESTIWDLVAKYFTAPLEGPIEDSFWPRALRVRDVYPVYSDMQKQEPPTAVGDLGLDNRAEIGRTMLVSALMEPFIRGIARSNQIAIDKVIHHRVPMQLLVQAKPYNEMVNEADAVYGKSGSSVSLFLGQVHDDSMGWTLYEKDLTSFLNKYKPLKFWPYSIHESISYVFDYSLFVPLPQRAHTVLAWSMVLSGILDNAAQGYRAEQGWFQYNHGGAILAYSGGLGNGSIAMTQADEWQETSVKEFTAWLKRSPMDTLFFSQMLLGPSIQKFRAYQERIYQERQRQFWPQFGKLYRVTGPSAPPYIDTNPYMPPDDVPYVWPAKKTPKKPKTPKPPVVPAQQQQWNTRPSNQQPHSERTGKKKKKAEQKAAYMAGKAMDDKAPQPPATLPDERLPVVRRVPPAPVKPTPGPQEGAHDPAFNKASTLIRQGATVEDLQQELGISPRRAYFMILVMEEAGFLPPGSAGTAPAEEKQVPATGSQPPTPAPTASPSTPARTTPGPTEGVNDPLLNQVMVFLHKLQRASPDDITNYFNISPLRTYFMMQALESRGMLPRGTTGAPPPEKPADQPPGTPPPAAGGHPVVTPPAMPTPPSSAAVEGASDHLYGEAVAFVRAFGRTSIRDLQEHFVIEQRRAYNIIQALEHAGVIVPMTSPGHIGWEVPSAPPAAGPQASVPPAGEVDGSKNVYYARAVAFVTGGAKVRVELVYRTFRRGAPGINKVEAAQMLEAMEKQGIVGPADANGWRTVLKPAQK